MRKILLLVISSLLFVSCYKQQSQSTDSWDLTEKQIDSISFSTTHHYAQGYNFIVKTDSLRLRQQAPSEEFSDTISVYGGDHIVVADFMTVSSDTIDTVWVKVARDQMTQGWVHEKTLLSSVEPDDSVSRFIDTFSDTHTLIFMALVVFVAATYGLRLLIKRRAPIVHFHDIDSFYPMLLALLVSSSATLYASIQRFDPESWRHFYYHPSLNPFALPPHLGLFISSVWAILIVALAVLDELRRLLSFSDTLIYLSGLAAVCAIDYIIFSISTLYYIGYPLLAAYFYFAIRMYVTHRNPYVVDRHRQEDSPS